MAGQRRRELCRHPRGRGLGSARLALAAVIVAAGVAAACSDLGRPISGPGRAGGGGDGGGDGGSAAVVGTWRNFTTFFDAGETIVSETRWTFAAGGTCFKVVTHTFVSAGVQDTIFEGSCRFTSGGSSVTITFTGSSVPTTFSVAFSNGDLLLDGFRFQRIG